MVESTPTKNDPYRYRLHGLTVESELLLPELVPCDRTDAPDVSILLGKTPPRLSQPRTKGVCYEIQPGQMLIWLDGVARFLISGGSEITVDPNGTGNAAETRRLLLSSPLGSLLLQRGLLPLHASAVSIGGEGVVFLGGPCAGKSTLAAMLWKRGFRILSDDLTVIRIVENGAVWILPGFPQLRLWPDSLVALGEDAEQFTWMRNDIEKRLVSCRESFESSAVPLSAIYYLEPSYQRELEVSPLRGVRGACALLQHTYSPAFLAGSGLQKGHLAQLTRLAKSTRMMSLARPESDVIAKDLAECVLGDFRS